jgi:hypothetical protein
MATQARDGHDRLAGATEAESPEGRAGRGPSGSVSAEIPYADTPNAAAAASPAHMPVTPACAIEPE